MKPVANFRRELAAIQSELQQMGFVLVRERNHQIWRDSRGRVVVLPKTPSDFRAVKNARALVKRMKES